MANKLQEELKECLQELFENIMDGNGHYSAFWLGKLNVLLAPVFDEDDEECDE